jgi:hypothetical protein
MFAMKVSLAAAVLLAAFFASPAYAQQYIYVANAGDDTVSKIDITTNVEVARYATWFTSGTNYIPHQSSAWAGAAPSRIAVNRVHEVFVLDRFFSTLTWPSWTNAPHLPVLLKIAPAGGTPGSNTSGGSVLSMLDINNNYDIDPGEWTDVRILWAKSVGNPAIDKDTMGRALCIDPSGNLWVGMFGEFNGITVTPGTSHYYKVDPNTGQMLAPLAGIPTPGHTPYGCQVDTKGRLWSVDESDSVPNTLAEIDTNTNQLVTVHPIGIPKTNYSISIFQGCGSGNEKVYLSDRSATPKTYRVYDPSTSLFSNSSLPSNAQFDSVAVAVDLNGDIVSGEHFGTGRVIKSHPNGTVVWQTTDIALGVGNTVPANDLHGIIIDEHNDVWAVHLRENRLVKYSGVNGKWLATVMVGRLPYTYGNPPPPTCPCAQTGEQTITCADPINGVPTYAWSFLFTNHSPFATSATGINISSSQVGNITPSHFQFPNPVPPNGQATVSGTFSVANPIPGSPVCLNIQLNAGAEGWCCPFEQVCFQLPKCQGCANLQGQFICQHGHPVLSLSITNQGPSTSQSVTISSNTPGVTVSPQTTTQTFTPNTPVAIPLTVTGAAPGQAISLSVSLSGPIDPKTGVNTWCCTSTVTVTYPQKACLITLDGWIFNDRDPDGIRDSEENGLSGWTATLTDSKGASRKSVSDAGGTYSFENVEAGTYRLSVQPLAGWRSTLPERGVVTVTIGGSEVRKYDFGFVKTQP